MPSYSEYLAQKMRNQLVFLDTRPRWTAAQFTEVTRQNADRVLDRRPTGLKGVPGLADSFRAANAYRTATEAQTKPPRYVPNAP